MHDRFTVTIHDVDGIKQFNLHQSSKKVIAVAVSALLFLLILGAAILLFLKVSIEDVAAKKEALQERNAQLMDSIRKTEEALAAKKNELDVVDDRLHDIETLIGLVPQENDSLRVRVEVAQLTSGQMAALLRYIPNGSPVEYKGITSKFGYRKHPTLGKREFHRGSDLRAKMRTPVHATADAIVEYGAFHKGSGYGRLIILDHNYGFKTYYGHLKKITVKPGDFVRKGDLIGYSGSSGMSNGPHLHYEVRFIQRSLNPYWFIKWTVDNYRQIFEKEKKVPWTSLIATITQQHLPTAPTTAPPSSPTALLSKGN